MIQAGREWIYQLLQLKKQRKKDYSKCFLTMPGYFKTVEKVTEEGRSNYTF